MTSTPDIFDEHVPGMTQEDIYDLHGLLYEYREVLRFRDDPKATKVLEVLEMIEKERSFPTRT